MTIVIGIILLAFVLGCLSIWIDGTVYDRTGNKSAFLMALAIILFFIGGSSL